MIYWNLMFSLAAPGEFSNLSLLVVPYNHTNWVYFSHYSQFYYSFYKENFGTIFDLRMWYQLLVCRSPLKTNKLLLFGNGTTQWFKKYLFIARRFPSVHHGRVFIKGKKKFLFNWNYFFRNANTFFLNRIFSLP